MNFSQIIILQRIATAPQRSTVACVFYFVKHIAAAHQQSKTQVVCAQHDCTIMMAMMYTFALVML